MKRILLIVMAILALILTGCGSSPAVLSAHLMPVRAHVKPMIKCGEIDMIKRGNKIVISIKDANCFKAQLKRCALDRKKLLIANRANVALIKKIGERR